MLDNRFLANNELKSLPETLDTLSAIEYLDVSRNHLTTLPFTEQSQLVELHAERNSISELDDSFSLNSLSYLNLANNALKQVDLCLFQMPALETLFLTSNSLRGIFEENATRCLNKDRTLVPAECKSALRMLDMSFNSLTRLHTFFDVFYFPHLEYLGIAYNHVETLSDNVKTLFGNRSFKLYYVHNYLRCESYEDLLDATECAASGQQRNPERVASYVLSGLALVLVAAAVPFYVVVLRLKARLAEEAQVFGLSEMEVDDETLGVRVTPATLTFGSESSQLPVYRECKDVLFLKGTKSRTAFRLVLPTVPSYKCVIDAAMTQGEVAKGEELGIELAITMMCTTSVQIPLLVVTEHGYATVRIEAESQLSTRLDADEIAMGAVLGVGGYGTVFRGTWRGVDVAVKVYNQTIMADFATRSDFEREVEMCFKLRMPYIVSFYGKTVSPDKTYIVMEYVPYGSLARLLAKRRFSLRYKVRMALDIARGMNYLHKNRIIHRDLKPDNVLVASIDPDSCVCGKLSDFNTSRFVGNEVLMTKTRGVGTPIYMAPEIHDGRHYSGAADVYSFALTMWSVWAQKEPYADLTSSLQLYQLIINGERLPVPSDIPEPLAALTRECWAQNPDDRPTFAAIVPRLEAAFTQMTDSESLPDDVVNATTTTTAAAVPEDTSVPAPAAAPSADDAPHT